jgi:hypothetical protein
MVAFSPHSTYLRPSLMRLGVITYFSVAQTHPILSVVFVTNSSFVGQCDVIKVQRMAVDTHERWLEISPVELQRICVRMLEITSRVCPSAHYLDDDSHLVAPNPPSSCSSNSTGRSRQAPSFVPVLATPPPDAGARRHPIVPPNPLTNPTTRRGQDRQRP